MENTGLSSIVHWNDLWVSASLLTGLSQPAQRLPAANTHFINTKSQRSPCQGQYKVDGNWCVAAAERGATCLSKPSLKAFISSHFKVCMSCVGFTDGLHLTTSFSLLFPWGLSQQSTYHPLVCCDWLLASERWSLSKQQLPVHCRCHVPPAEQYRIKRSPATAQGKVAKGSALCKCPRTQFSYHWAKATWELHDSSRRQNQSVCLLAGIEEWETKAKRSPLQISHDFTMTYNMCLPYYITPVTGPESNQNKSSHRWLAWQRLHTSHNNRPVWAEHVNKHNTVLEFARGQLLCIWTCECKVMKYRFINGVTLFVKSGFTKALTSCSTSKEPREREALKSSH